jgi:hypothetical protein
VEGWFSCLIATDASVEPAKLDEGICFGIRDLGGRWAIPTAAAESFLLLPAGHRSFAPCRSEPGPPSLINRAGSVLSPTLPNFAPYLDLGAAREGLQLGGGKS